MMKKIILIVLVLALLAPAVAFGATEFSLGGYIKLDMFWDSTQTSKNNLGRIARDNDALFQHGHFNMTSQATRLNFTIKGPKLWGATTTGFVEIDFDAVSDPQVSATGTAYAPRLRHAMFRLDWPETQLLMGMYWGFLAEYGPETTGDADLQFNGWINNRVPQIRLTQKFAGDWTVAGMIAKPYDPGTADVTFSGNLPTGSFGTQLGLEGQSSETPQLQGKIAYEKVLYGKAAFYGRPRGFTAQVSAAWQRTRYRANNFNTAVTASTLGQNAFSTVPNAVQTGQQYLDPWIVQGTLFVPVIPTHSANLAGTASILAQYYIGQGTNFVGAGPDADNSYFVFSHFLTPAGFNMYDKQLMQQFGGFVQGQYYFTNQWFLNAVWGFRKDYGIPQDRAFVATPNGPFNQYMVASQNDVTKMNQEFDLTLWYRPIEAIKFGLQYSYTRTDWLQKLNNPSVGTASQANSPQPNAGAKDVGEAHRIQFVAFMFF
jgi:hypothetical protein